MTHRDPDQNLEPYSCSRCRRLKKKCSREHPSCSHCVKSKKDCAYPGKAPRRTKKELKIAMERGEFIPSKRHKTSRSNSTDGIFSGGTTASPDISAQQTPQSYESVLSLISVLSSMNSKTSPTELGEASSQPSATSLSHSDINNSRTLLMGSDRILPPVNVPISPNSNSNIPLPPISSTGTVVPTNPTGKPPTSMIQASRIDSNDGSMGLSPETSTIISNLLNEPRKLSNPLSIASNGAIGNSEGRIPFLSSFTNQMTAPKIPKVESTPIQAPYLEIETINSVFKGGKRPIDLNANGTFKTLDKNLMDRFIAAYFRHNHRLFPMINKIDFFKKFCKIKEYNFELLNQEFDDLYIFKLYMILAIGCTTLRRAGMLSKDEEELSEHLAYFAMTKFKAITRLQNIETIQCHILVGIYSFFEPKGWSSWTISGIIMRLTIGLGLNRDLPPKKKATSNPSDIEARYRVFWSAYCFERLVATVLGRLSAIDDEDITVPLPTPLYEAEEEEIDVTNTMIRLRKIGGLIYQRVHSVRCGKPNRTIEEKQKIIADLRNQLDEIYSMEQNKMKEQNRNHINDNNVISFHSSDIWLAMRYSQLQILLYKPSTLIPKPPIDSLSILGEFCLKAWQHTYTLYQKKLLPLNWITLFRTLTICNTILYCLCQWAIDLIESKIEIQQIVEILQHFGGKWVFATKCAEVFKGISNCILDISLSDGKVPNMDKLTSELFGANDAYHDILDENNVDISWADKLPN